jgi:tripartite-type tricarboxylate transporter receptor subunit TctC
LAGSTCEGDRRFRRWRTDRFVRAPDLAQTLRTNRQDFFVENVSGAGGSIAMARAAQASPDGYTILVTGGNFTKNPYLCDRVSYEPLKDFDAVTLGAATPVVLTT